MASFTIGEEVHFEGRRFVVSQMKNKPSLRYRLLATTPTGTEFVWATPDRLEKIERYTKPVQDTNR